MKKTYGFAMAYREKADFFVAELERHGFDVHRDEKNLRNVFVTADESQYPYLRQLQTWVLSNDVGTHEDFVAEQERKKERQRFFPQGHHNKKGRGYEW